MTCPPDAASERRGIVGHRALSPTMRWGGGRDSGDLAVRGRSSTLPPCWTSGRLERAWNEAEVRRLTGPALGAGCCSSGIRGGRGSRICGRCWSAGAAWGSRATTSRRRSWCWSTRRGLPRPRMNADLAMRGRFFEIDCSLGGRAGRGRARRPRASTGPARLRGRPRARPDPHRRGLADDPGHLAAAAGRTPRRSPICDASQTSSLRCECRRRST